MKTKPQKIYVTTQVVQIKVVFHVTPDLQDSNLCGSFRPLHKFSHHLSRNRK